MLKNLIIGFFPWIIYFSLAGHGQDQLDAAIILALIAFIFTGISSLTRGFILSWTTFTFFTLMLIAVVWFHNDWFAENSLIIANGMLAVVTLGSLLVKVPFTIQYARQQVPKGKWNSPLFIQINQFLTSIWAISFTLSMIAGILLISNPHVSQTFYQLLNTGSVVIAVLFTIYLPNGYRYKKMREKTAKNFYLQGNFAPVYDELDVADLPIIGKIPADLTGVYMRNGPNPAFPPLSYTYPFDGDGMIHAVYLQDGKALYRNRFVETKGLLTERRAGKSLYGGIMNPVIPNPKWLKNGGDQGPFKNGAFIHIIQHAQRFLALWEGGSAYELDASLKTLGEWRPGTEKPINVGPHSHLDPRTGERWMINYDIKPPFLTVYCIDAQGLLKKQWNVDKPYATMIHDFALTENYLVFFDCPIVLNAEAIATAENIIEWKPELGSRIGLIPKDGSEAIWLHTEAFFVFHFANAYEFGDNVIIDFVRHPHFQWLSDAKKRDPHAAPYLARTTIDRVSKHISHEALSHEPIEFPRIREDLDSLSHQFIYAPGRLIASINHFHALIKYDTESKTKTIHDFGAHCEIGEAVFAPKSNSTTEDDGYLMLFVYNKDTNNSQLAILDAKNLSFEPIALIDLPRRIPNGLHGSWIP